MRLKFAVCAVLLVLTFGMVPLQAQISQPSHIEALRISSPIVMDGILSEPSWQKAMHISNFTQRELNEGQPATERTEVAILYDDNNLYIGVWCFDSQPDQLVAQEMKRDFVYSADDNFKIVIDTYHDGRNGYLFITNPNAARFDALIQNNGDRVNESWNGVWNVKTKVTDKGWFAEFVIPFSTLKFSTKPKQVWGINFERNIRRKREQDLWQGWSRDSEIEQVSRAGILTGIEGISNVTLIEFKPYGIAGIETYSDAPTDTKLNGGGDLNYLITPSMKLNLTVNTDFAQVESDRMQVNLTRFSLYYPEKRAFFLEGRNYFDFSLGRRTQPFYSRRIGLTSDGRAIPILAGARLLGKEGATTIGAMSLQTAKKDTIPSTNYTVLRWKQDIFKQSTIGVIGVGKVEPHRRNMVYGTDFLYSTTSLFGDKNFMFGGAIAQSYTSDAENKRGLASRIFFDFPNDLIDFSAVWDRSDVNFNAETGYQQRTNYQMYNADLRIMPRPKFIPWIQKFVFKPFDFNYYVNDQTHKIQSLWSEFRPLGFTTKGGEFFEFNIQRRAENLEKDFNIHDNIVIPKGEYWFTDYEIQYGSFRGKPYHYFIFFNWGTYYNGNRSEWAVRNVYQFSKHVNASVNYSQNFISLPGGDFIIHELSGRLSMAVNPDLYGSVFGQWNNDNNEVLLNFRVNWIPTPGTNFYFVVNQGFDTSHKGWKATNLAILTKLVWRFVL
jgi:hypothetical protein